MLRSLIIIWIVVVTGQRNICAQSSSIVDTTDNYSFFTPAPRYDSKRVKYSAALAGTAYVGFSIGFYNAWYKGFEQGPFQLFNDWDEWRNMDKYGHAYSGYFQSYIVYRGAKWTGLSENSSILTGVACGTLFQTTIEVMDGFSTKWGFSLPDIGFNTIGVGAFYFQQKYWGEQKFKLKQSSLPRTYSTDPIFANGGFVTDNLENRANNLYGSSWAERFLKDYNNHIYWISADMHALFDMPSYWPKWLNLAVGIGAEGMFGGFENNWRHNGGDFSLPNTRKGQFYLSLDYNLERIKTSSPALKGLFTILDIFKYPAPGIEFTTDGEVIFRLVILR